MMHLLSRLWIRVIYMMRFVPMSGRNAIASVLGRGMWYALPRRRHVTRTNLRLCFPDWTEEKRVAVAKSAYRNMARAALDHGVLWKGTREEVAAMVRYEGMETVTDEANRPMIIIAPHFIGLDSVGAAFNLHVKGCSLYQTQSNPDWDAELLAGRKRFADPVLIAKSGNGSDLKDIMRAMRNGLPFYYLPDMDHGIKNSIFVPFFGVPAATVSMVSRLAQVTKAKVVFCMAEMTDEGYVGHISECWKDFPTGDVDADTRRVTAELESWILKYPDQYLWMHRRFKTRPEGSPSVY